jgi:dCTP diphosphatase
MLEPILPTSISTTVSTSVSAAAMLGDKLLNLSDITRQFRAIAEIKGWQVYHTPKNLAAAVAVEASELLAEFQWLTAEESQRLNLEKKACVANEVADVMMYLCELCEQLNINISEAVQTKVKINTQRFNEE